MYNSTFIYDFCKNVFQNFGDSKGLRIPNEGDLRPHLMKSLDTSLLIDHERPLQLKMFCKCLRKFSDVIFKSVYKQTSAKMVSSAFSLGCRLFCLHLTSCWPALLNSFEMFSVIMFRFLSDLGKWNRTMQAVSSNLRNKII